MRARSRYSAAAAACGVLLTGVLFSPASAAATSVEGRVVDINGRAVAQAMVTITRGPKEPGASATTVFTDAEGRFRFPDSYEKPSPVARALGYRQIDAIAKADGSTQRFTLVMRPESNQADVAPASAWLSKANPDDRTAVVMTCVACHQMPAPDVRAYAKLIHEVPGADPAEARRQSWHTITKYMNYLWAWEFARGGDQGLPEASHVYSGGDAEPTAALLARTFQGPLQELTGYSYGAPLIVNERTVIREYEVPRPNAIREAITLADSRMLWTADVSANRIVRIDAATGELRDFEIPSPKIMGPHTLVRARDGALWVAPFFNSIIARLDPRTERWQTWQIATQEGGPIGIHDLTFDSSHELVTDRRGWIWYSDIGNNAVGRFDPRTGKSAVHRTPPVPGREGDEQLYGIVMSSDRTRVWYSQLGIGVFGSFNVETQKFENVVTLPDRNAGPRRLAMAEQDVLYVPLYGAGQLVEYDARANRMIGIYDLPDRASAPYAVTWDSRRGVLWIATSNADAIYRFDPRDKSFGVLPLPRQGAFLRMIAIDRQTGALVTSYANIVVDVKGPRMALMIDPGDGGGAAVSRTSDAKDRSAGEGGTRRVAQ